MVATPKSLGWCLPTSREEPSTPSSRRTSELQITISQQLGLELTTVSNFFMNARRRSLDKWLDDNGGSSHSANSSVSTCSKA
ncbi:unnamed protein product [Oncorhynchus mykiss]|uniref:Homeobox domain-containing protein n=1 Tax=Oncorhynchus mykiss TaxID=8022 RepID=A0A060YHG5_ONCMY|nr:unnamed protein product [Oncorhynchus mykiss]